MRVELDTPNCHRHARCVAFAPEIFDLGAAMARSACVTAPLMSTCGSGPCSIPTGNNSAVVCTGRGRLQRQGAVGVGETRSEWCVT